MNKILSFFSLIILGTAVSGFSAEPANSLTGQWNVSDQGLILVFSGKDSLSVSSTTDSSVQGKGTFVKTDTTFSASIKNNDIVMKMDYRYRWKNKDNIEAQAVLFTVNGDSVESPKDWTAMTRYVPAKKTDVTGSNDTKSVKSSK